MRLGARLRRSSSSLPLLVALAPPWNRTPPLSTRRIESHGSHCPTGLGPVTGRLDASAAALVFDELHDDADWALDLWGYADGADPDMPLRFILGLSTVCAVRKDMSTHPSRMKSRYRRVVAVARLAQPYCVWVR